MKGLIKIENLIMYIISTLISILSILIAYMALKRNKDKDNLKEAIDSGILLSDIGYIKKSLDRIEKRLEHVEINYNDLLKRVIILEEKVNING
jgi:divalent metal cation (Fe/Co/Zn/Cd) transporter